VKISTKTRYGVRALFDLAFHGQGKATQAHDVAARQSVPLPYLEQIFGDLRRAQLVDAKRGPNGGYFLARSATTITLGDVLRAVQGPIELCDADEVAAPTTRRVAADIWRELEDQVSACFESVTIGDLCRRGAAEGHRPGEPLMYFI